MFNINEFIIEKYNNKSRVFSIKAELKEMGYKMNCEQIRNIIGDYKKNMYLFQEKNGVLYCDVIDSYLKECEKDFPNVDLLDVIFDYPELTYGEIKNIIDGYYEMLNQRKPKKYRFPKGVLEEELKKKTMEEVVLEYGYSSQTIKKCLGIELTKEELFAKKMQLLEMDSRTLKERDFNKKYKNIGLDIGNAKRLIKEYKEKNKNK